MSVNRPVLQHDRHHLQEVRLTGTEETRKPGSIRAVLVVVLEESGQPVGRFVRENVFPQLRFQLRLVIRLDHALDRTANVLGKHLLYDHLPSSRFRFAPQGC